MCHDEGAAEKRLDAVIAVGDAQAPTAENGPDQL
jgi:hypothetical protein